MYFLSQQEIEEKVSARAVKIGFIGLGRVGLPLAATLADEGFKVLGIDVKSELVAKVNAGESPFTDETGLGELIQKVVGNKALKAATQMAAIKECGLVIIAVPTLIKGQEPEIDAVRVVADELARNFSSGKMIVLQSTVPPFTTQNVLGKAIEKITGFKAGEDFGLAYSPERTQSPQVLRDLKTYPRVVGGIDEKSAFITSRVYSTFAPGVIKMGSLVAAEMEKVIENAYRDVNIAFANELACICELYGVDVQEIIEASNSQPYSHILNPGLVGGHCIPMDPYYIIGDARGRGVEPRLMQTARDINESMFQHVLHMIDDGCKKVTVLGLSFKKDVKSFETSHTLKLASLLQQKGYDVTIHDPFLNKSQLPTTDYQLPTANYQLPTANCQLSTDLYHAIEGSDCVMLSTAHSEYKEIDFDKVKELMRGNLFIDIRGMFDPKKLTAAGFRYKGLGRVQVDY